MLASVGATTVTALESTAVQKGSIIYEFKNPEENSKPMVRYWLPDAAADPEIVADEITSMYEAGYRGVEIAMVPRCRYLTHPNMGLVPKLGGTC